MNKLKKQENKCPYCGCIYLYEAKDIHTFTAATTTTSGTIIKKYTECPRCIFINILEEEE